MSMDDCRAAARAATKGALSEQEVNELVDRIVALSATIRQENPAVDEATARTQAAEQLTAEERQAAYLARRARLMAARARAQRVQFYGTFQEGDELKALRSLTVGIEDAGEGRGRSTDAVQHALSDHLQGQLLNGIRQAGLQDELLSPWRGRDLDFELRIAQEMERAAMPADNPRAAELQPTGDPRAEMVGRMFHAIIEQGRQMMNDAGAFIGQMPGYIVRQSHDAIKVRGGMFRRNTREAREAAFTTWRDYILERLDHARTFPDMTQGDINHFMRSAWTHIVTGMHERADGAEDWLSGFVPASSTARKVSQERAFHFKSARDWFEYNERFGTGSIVETVMQHIHKASSATALMRTWGPSPRAAWEADVRSLSERALRRGDDVMTKALNNWRTKAEFDAIDGSLSAVDPLVGGIVRGIKSQQMLSKLGGMLLSSASDLANRASVLRHANQSYLGNYANLVTHAVNGVAEADRAEAIDLIGAGVDGVLGSMTTRFNTQGGVSGASSKMMSIFYRANGFHYWITHLRRSTGEVLASNLANRAGQAFEALDGLLQESLSRYGINTREWDLIRSGARYIPERRRAYLTTDAVDYIHDDDLAAYANIADDLEPQARALHLREARTELRISLQAYFTEHGLDAATEPRARERALLSMGVKPGSPAWVALQLVMQFKSFATTVWTRHMAREYERGGGGQATGWAIAHIIAATTALGGMAMCLKDLAKGRTPRDFTKPETMVAALIQGGGLGIYGDFLFGNYNRFGAGPIETLSGPAVGTLGQFMSVLAATRDGDDARAKALRLGIDQVPFVNLFYTRAALDYLVLYHIQEAMNPGYLRRMEQRMKKDNNQEFLFPPEQYAN